MGDPVIYEPEPTVGIDSHQLLINEGKIALLDFGGQLEYTVTHQFFLSMVCRNRTKHLLPLNPLVSSLEGIRYDHNKFPALF